MKRYTNIEIKPAVLYSSFTCSCRMSKLHQMNVCMTRTLNFKYYVKPVSNKPRKQKLHIKFLGSWRFIYL